MSDHQDEHHDDVRWHALNYRTAAPQHAQAMWVELEACIARQVAAERDRYSDLMLAVEWMLADGGNMNQEHLARIRGAWERA